MSGDRSVSPSVVVVGSANADVVVRTARHPRPGETVLGTGVAIHRGGKGANQAVAVARNGVSVALVGRLGNDANAELLREGLRADNVDDRYVGNCKHDPSGTALITVADDGENSIVVVPGANAMLRSVHVDDALAVIEQCRVVLAQLEVPLEVVLHAFRCARAAGARTVLNAAPARAMNSEELSLVDVLIVNEHELRLVTDCDDIDRALSIASAIVPTIVVTLGSRGARMRTATMEHVLAPHTVSVVDTTGAGDAFCGAFVASMARNSSLEDALVSANAAGALATTIAGAQPSLPSSTSIDELLRSHTK